MAIKDGLAGEAYGLEMYEAQRDGEELEVLNLDLPQDLEKLEQLICQMTSYQPNTRPTSLEVQARVTAIATEVFVFQAYKISMKSLCFASLTR